MPSREQRNRQIPSSMLKVYEKSVTSKAAGIKAFCQECCGYNRKTVAECKDFGCPLWHHRPYQSKDEDDDEQE